MRKIKRFLKSRYAAWRLSPRLKSLSKQIRNDLNFNELPNFKLSGYRGNDTNYLVTVHGKKYGMMRVLNPYKHRKPPAPSMPYTLMHGQERLIREHDIYSRGAPLGLTPKPLWRCDDALMCDYLPYVSLFDILEKDFSQFWGLATMAAQATARLHSADIFHTDMSFFNILVPFENVSAETMVFIDFEYSKSDHINDDQARAYDYLRLLESAWKFIPEPVLNDTIEQDKWFHVFLSHHKACDLSPLKPALGRVMNHPRFKTLDKSNTAH